MYHLLVADDSEAELECIIFLISKFKLPFEITSALNGEEAFNYLKQEPFDILLTDIQMPFMNGLDLARNAFAMYPAMRVVIISAHEDFSYAKTALQLGVCEYLLKPIHPQELNDILQKVLCQIKEQESQKELDSMTTDYAKNHLLLQIIRGTSSFDSHLQRLAQTYFGNFNIIALLESRQNLFDSLQPEPYIRSVCDFDFYFLNITPSLGLLLLDGHSMPTSLSFDSFFEKAIDNFHQISNIPIKISYGIFSQPSQLPAIYKKLEELLENAFLFPKCNVFSLNLYEEIKNTHDSPCLSYASGKIRDVKRYIYEHYGEDLSLDLLSSIIYVHPDYLSRLFKKETGYNLNQFIKQYRMEKAKELLTSTQLKISAIGIHVGYPNSSYFCKTFNDYYGVSPEKFREKKGIL